MAGKAAADRAEEVKDRAVVAVILVAAVAVAAAKGPVVEGAEIPVAVAAAKGPVVEGAEILVAVAVVVEVPEALAVAVAAVVAAAEGRVVEAAAIPEAAAVPEAVVAAGPEEAARVDLVVARVAGQVEAAEAAIGSIRVASGRSQRPLATPSASQIYLTHSPFQPDRSAARVQPRVN